MFKFDPKNVDDIANKIKGIMPESLKSSKEEMHKTLKSGAEEYDIQVSLLRKCQDRIDELEAKIIELEENK